MIISHKFKFIYIKNQKTAGTSIEVALSKICGDEDIVTHYPLLSIEGFKPRNYEGFDQHIAASEIIKKIPLEIWNQYYKFTFERNPFDKMVSWYWDKKRDEQFNKSFQEFCVYCSNNLEEFPLGYDLYSINDKVVVDFVGRYETLKKDFDYVCKKLGLPSIGEFPLLRTGYREDPSHYSKYYDYETQKIVEKHFWREIQQFNYKFENKHLVKPN